VNDRLSKLFPPETTHKISHGGERDISRIQWPNVIGTASLVIMTNGRHLGRNPRTGALPFLMLKADVASLSMILFGHATIGHFQ
jgi:hypothetical protein